MYCDMNGEPYRADEFGFAALRTNGGTSSRRRTSSRRPIAGATWLRRSAPLALMLATIAGQKAYANGPFAFLWASSESGERGAALLGVANGERGVSDASHRQGQRRGQLPGPQGQQRHLHRDRFRTSARRRRPAAPCRFRIPNISQSATLAKGTTTVKADGGMMIAIKGSEFSTVERRQRGRRGRGEVQHLHEGVDLDSLLLRREVDGKNAINRRKAQTNSDGTPKWSNVGNRRPTTLKLPR